MDASSGTGTAVYPSGATEFTLGFYWGSRCSIFVCCVVFCRSPFVFFPFWHCFVLHSCYGFWLPFRYLQTLTTKPYEIILIIPLWTSHFLCVSTFQQHLYI